MKILLVEPNYRSKFPPLGLLKLSSHHKSVGDSVSFLRGKDKNARDIIWDRIYISSLFTWELPRTVKTINYYEKSVRSSDDLIVGGIGATLLPDYVSNNSNCKIITGPLDRKGMIDSKIPALDSTIPDYNLIENLDYQYNPQNSYFTRATQGCIRKCPFCAVCQLEPKYYYIKDWWKKVEGSALIYGEKQNLVFLDNNVLATDKLELIIKQIKNLGFQKTSKLNNKQRLVDFNQGIDARLITNTTAKLLSELNIKPIRLAFDTDEMEKPYTKAIKLLSRYGFNNYTNYLMYNFHDTPKSFYNRMKINFKLSKEFDVTITGFPMRYIPINEIYRNHVSKKWPWRYLRGVQCVLRATYGLVSPNKDFFDMAFGSSYKEFCDIISMPDDYILFRNKNKSNIKHWKKEFYKLSKSSRNEFLFLLQKLHDDSDKRIDSKDYYRFKVVLKHYYSLNKLKVGGKL